MQYAIYKVSRIGETKWREQQSAIVGTPDDGWKNQFWMGKQYARSHASAMSANCTDVEVVCFEVVDQDYTLVSSFTDGVEKVRSYDVV